MSLADELAYMSAAEMAMRIRRRDFSPVEIVDALIGTFISVALPRMLIERGQGTAQVGLAFTLIGIFRSLLHAALWGAVLFAIFSGRGLASAKQADQYGSGATIQ